LRRKNKMNKIIANKDEFKKLVRDSKETVIVDFFANWCGPCKMLSPVLEELGDKYKIYKVNVDDNMDLAEEFNVSSIPCVIKFIDGREYSRFVGMRSKDEVEDFIK